jgi:hypothetical protein
MTAVRTSACLAVVCSHDIWFENRKVRRSDEDRRRVSAPTSSSISHIRPSTLHVVLTAPLTHDRCMADDTIPYSFDLFIEVSVMIHESSPMAGSKTIFQSRHKQLDGSPTSVNARSFLCSWRGLCRVFRVKKRYWGKRSKWHDA